MSQLIVPDKIHWSTKLKAFFYAILFWMGTAVFIQKRKCQKYWQESKQLWFNRLLALVDLGIFFGMIHGVASVTFICHYVIPQPIGDSLFWIIAVIYVLVFVPFQIYRKENRKKLIEKKVSLQKHSQVV